MAKGLLLDCDEQVASWAFLVHNRIPMHIDRAIGVLDDGQLAGAILFSSYNTVNAELSYYGKNTLTPGIIRATARFALYELRLARLTVIVPKRPSFMLNRITKFGFRYEGVQRRHYGPTDSPRDTGCRFVVFREDMEKLAGLNFKEVA